MRPLKLTLSAFGPYEQETVIDFTTLGDCSFFLIHGATGAGKTTILDAICYAFYGDASVEGRTGNMLRSQQAGPEQETFVEFLFRIGEKTYRLRRNPDYMRKSKRQTKDGSGLTAETAGAELWRLDGEPDCLATGPAKVTARMTELLGFASEQFRQVVLLPQGEFRRLLMADSQERQSIMEVLFRTELYRKIEDSLKGRAQHIQAQYQEIQREQDFVLKDAGAEDSAAFRQQLAELEMQQRTAHEHTQQLLQQREAARQQEHAGRESAARFAALDAARQQLAEDEVKLGTVAAYKDQLEKAQLAAGLGDLEEQARQADAAAAAKKKNASQQELILQQLQTKLAAAQRCYEKMRSRGPELQAMQQKLSLLGEYQRRSAGLGAASQQAATAQEQVRQQRGCQQAVMEKLQHIQQELAERQKQEKQQSVQAAGRSAAALRLEQLEARQQQLADLLQSQRAEQQAQAVFQLAAGRQQAAQASYEQQRVESDRLQHLFLAGQAELLARGLRDGSACPVCGSIEHPQPAVSAELVPDEQEIRRAQGTLRRLDEERQAAAEKLQQAQAALSAAKGSREEKQHVLGEQPEDIKSLQAAVTAARSTLEKASAAEGLQQRLAAEIVSLTAANEEQLRSSEESRLVLARLEQEQAQAAGILQEKLTSLPEQYQEPGQLSQAVEQLERQQAALQAEQEQAEKAFRELETAVAAQAAVLEAAQSAARESGRQVQHTEAVFTARREAAGFASLEEYRQALAGKFSTAAGRAAIGQHIRSFEDAHTAHGAAWEKASQETCRLERPELERLAAALAKAEKDVNESYAAEKKLEADLQRGQQQQQRLSGLLAQSAALEKEYSTAGRLAAVASGDNIYRTSFQRYVLRSLLHDVVEAANVRLRLMTRNQYEIHQTMEVRDQRKRAGLDLVIFDAYTGYERQMATLSGGESFLASLSLALGLADVVQSYAGGIRLDTIFIDEGFGTLDAETLDMAIRALLELQKGGRLVGIISHVEELKERIDARLEVTKSRDGGSQARFIIG